MIRIVQTYFRLKCFLGISWGMINVFLKNLICNQKDNLAKMVVITRVPSSGASQAVKGLLQSSHEVKATPVWQGQHAAAFQGWVPVLMPSISIA